MEVKIFDSELKIMQILWREGDLTARQLAKILKEQIGWKSSTTYTIIGKLIEKGAIERCEASFTCKALITKRQVQQYETKILIDRLFDDSFEIFLSDIFNGEK